MGKLVVLGRDNPKIKELIDGFVELKKHTQEKLSFIEKQFKDLKQKEKELKAEFDTNRKALWAKLDEEIDAQGYLKNIGIDKAAKDVNMSWDDDVGAIKLADEQKESDEPAIIQALRKLHKDGIVLGPFDL